MQINTVIVVKPKNKTQKLKFKKNNSIRNLNKIQSKFALYQ